LLGLELMNNGCDCINCGEIKELVSIDQKRASNGSLF
jgi:hypothetical protein